MTLPELIAYQVQWEADRGIHNPNHNLDRTQEELDEAHQEPDAFKRLMEMVDVLIVLSGGIGKLMNELNIPPGAIETMINGKLSTNMDKYPEEAFQGITTAWAITRCRHLWAINPDDWDGGEYY